MASQVDRVLSVYRTLAQIPVLTGAQILKNGLSVTSYWTERNIENNKTVKMTFRQEMDENLNVTCNSGFGIDISDEIISSVSPLETFKAVIREQTESKDSKKQFLEIWKYRQMTHCISLSALEIHGDVYVDSEFGNLSWNNSEDKLVYVAERKLPKTEPFYKRKPIKSKDKDDNNEPPARGQEYDYKPEWGEQLVGKHLSSIVVCEILNESFTVIDCLPSSWSPGQVIWSPDGQCVIGVAWETEPRRLGLIFCSNRPSFIFMATLDGKYAKISKENKAVRSPRFSKDGKYLFWLERNVGGPHHDCHRLMKTSWPLSENSKIEIVIDIVEDFIMIENDKQFTGIYCLALPKQAFSSDGKRLIFSTQQKTEIHTYVLNTENNKIYDISDNPTQGSTTALDVHNNLILASRSSLKQPAELIIAKLPKAGEEKSITWYPLEKECISIPKEITDSIFEIMDLQQSNDEPIRKSTAIYFGANLIYDKYSPLIVYPHGGPHSGFVNSFSIEAALLRMLGFAVVHINYRGSIGAGQKSVHYLTGKVGSVDVEDCMLAMNETIRRFRVYPEKCMLLGRSHGGFLVLQLSGQYPDKFGAVVAGNPVSDISSMMNSTDIPDWCSTESGYEFNEVGPVSDEFLLKMRKVSPFVHAHLVKAPTLMCLGSKDKRVPYHQGIEYYHKIKANGCKARMLIYDDNHALSSRSVEIDHLINGALWFLEHSS